MARFEKLVGTFVITALMILALTSWLVSVQDKNDAAQKIEDNAIFNDSLSGLTQVIETSNEEAESKYAVFNSEEPKTGFGSIVLFGIVSVGKSFSNIIFQFFGAIIKFPLIILGISATVYNLVLTWLIIIAIVAVWLLYKLGG